ncbi:monothiol glutaredoxin-5 [Crepidotus variabilis]|uniref:Monothiol glutaredoxin-5, mitochondrial n=1 Tax=Crepidotus variabilis TaxID=179855 RepID=A0A9P6E6E3_9AGAR|nr:monothiol glutaredoxin-5 [Crepidotus variabilis]
MFRPVLRSSSNLLRTATPSTALGSRLAAYRCLSQEARSKIERAVKEKPVVMFMKGTPAEPQCGFSRAAAQILDLQGVEPEKLQTYNVLADPELRDGIKEFSEWPTIPQIYVNGTFVGGCDILIGMHQSGELETLLENNGVIPKVEPSEDTAKSTAASS